MNLFSKAIFIGIFLFLFFNLKAQKLVQFSGVLFNAVDSTPIVNAHIINSRTSFGVISGQKGGFNITAKKGDTLIISFVGYEKLFFTVKKEECIIYLNPKEHLLDSYNVLSYKNFGEFRQAFIETNIIDTDDKVNQSIYLSKQELRSYGGSGLLQGGISALLAKNNKYMLDKKKYKTRIDNFDKDLVLLSDRFSFQRIKKITAIKDSSNVRAFMNYCDFSEDFIKTSSDYDFFNRIFSCFEEYNSLIANNN